MLRGQKETFEDGGCVSYYCGGSFMGAYTCINLSTCAL